MKSMKKIIAAVVAFAMAFAGVVIMVSNDDIDATASSASPSLEFKNSNGDVYDPDEGWNVLNNKAIGNQISVSFDSTTNTYYVTGTLAKVGTLDELKNATPGSTAAMFYSLWSVDETPLYGFVMNLKSSSSTNFVYADAYHEGTIKKIAVNDVRNMVVYASQSTYEIDYYVIDNASSITELTTTALNTYLAANPDTTKITLSVNVTLSEEKNAGKGYVAVENGNALLASSITNGTDTAGGKWEYNATTDTLTLNNYNGKEYFSADITNLILVGDNTITLKGVTNAIKNTGSNKITIKSVDGVGSLTIDMESTTSSEAIYSAGAAVAINGVDVSISMSEKYATAPTAASGFLVTKGIYAESFEIYDGSLKLKRNTVITSLIFLFLPTGI